MQSLKKIHAWAQMQVPLSYAQPHVKRIILHKPTHFFGKNSMFTNEPVHEISNNVVCATSKDSD